jgi:sugar transferase (PEP-CTERM/EpsH1 system associated)
MGAMRQKRGSGDEANAARKPRILFVLHRTPYPPNKGDKLRSFWELKELGKWADVDLFAFYDDPDDGRYAAELKKYCGEVYLEKLAYFRSRLNATRALLSGRSFTTGFFYSPKMAEKIQSALRSRKYDRILVFSSSMAQYVETSEVTRILDLVDVDSDKWEQYAKQGRGPSRWLWGLEANRLGEYEVRIVKRFSTTLVCTEAEANLLRSRVPQGKIRVLQNFLDVDKYDPQQTTLPESVRRWQPYMVFSGSMDYFPNVDAANYFYQEIVPLVRREIPETRFVIAGRNPDRSIQHMSSDAAVLLTGSVPDMTPYICGAAVAVVPMRIARGVQNKILEALAGGVPVVSTSAAAKALPESLRSLLLVADSPSDFSAAVIRVLREGGPIAGSRLRAALKDHMEHLDLSWQLQTLVQGSHHVRETKAWYESVRSR